MTQRSDSQVDDVAAVVVHHRHFPGVLDTIRSLIDQGIATTSIVVVDNSGDAVASRLSAALPDGCDFLEVENRGYGHAVNAAIDRIAHWPAPPAYLLTSTHETLPEPGSIPALVAALAADATVAAAGPSLTTLSDGQKIYWSHGGYCTSWLNIPRHVGNGDPVGEPLTGNAVRRDWVDGAFVMYRWSVLRDLGFREDFFLYFEETELHARLRKAGHAVVWVPGATVMQSTGGVPAYLQARNLQRYQRLHGNRWQQLLAVPVSGLRRALRSGINATSEVVREYIRGWRDGR